MTETRQERDVRFGNRVRDLRTSKGLSQRALGKRIGVSFTYVSKIENEKLDFGDFPSEVLICRIAEVLEADPDELLLMAKKIPERIRKRVFERPDAFRRLAALDDMELDAVLRRLARRRQKV
jgi:transcriptional regulator with XRE-family HTH domain